MRVFDIKHAISQERRLRLNVSNMECSPDHGGRTIDAVSVKCHMSWLRRSMATDPSLWGHREDLFKNYVHFYTVAGWGVKLGNDANGDRMQLTACKSRKKKCKTPMGAPHFYATSMPGDDNQYSTRRALLKMITYRFKGLFG